MYKKTRLLKCLGLIGLAIACTQMLACGFKLRGDYQLPMSVTVVLLDSPTSSSEVVKQLKRHLRSAGVVVYDSKPEVGEYFLLSLSEAQNQRRILSIDNNGRAQEYELSYSIRYSAGSFEDEKSLEEKEVLVIREYLSDPLDPLGSNAEQALLSRDMEVEAARLIMEGITIQ